MVVKLMYAGAALSLLCITLVQQLPVLSLVLGLVSLLLGAYIIVLLYKRESTEYYDAQSAPKY